jgi:hypothetical protein
LGLDSTPIYHIGTRHDSPETYRTMQLPEGASDLEKLPSTDRYAESLRAIGPNNRIAVVEKSSMKIVSVEEIE